ncbi:MAG: protein translocase subunit SecD [Actinobacteria bacterium]|nr:protein translocase subunit SecD [Actinomycetota bacterium]MBU2687366.1 protein translocase subunit SecD [Actinomycetota bacterium]
MSKNTKNWISIGVVALILVALYAATFAFDLKPRLGLDLQGGVSLVYEAVGKTVDPQVLAKTVEKIRSRVDSLGVSEPDITTQGSRNLIVQLPGISDPERAKALVGQTAQLQFRLVQESKNEADAKKDPAWAETTGEALKPDAVIVLPLGEGKDKAYLKLGPTLLTGDALKKAQVAFDNDGTPKVAFEMNSEGAGKFKDITTNNKDKQLAIVLDYKVESAPNINEPITDGSGEITGKFTDKEAKDLAIVLNIGALPVELKLLTEQDVSASLGKDSLDKALLAGVIGLIIVALYMLLFYRALGLVTVTGLGVFGLMMYGTICVLGEFWSLTIAGIAGIIVAIGITADSYVVYFERLKEDIRAGRTIRSSADSAYKSAFRTILAADTVSFAAAAILYLFAVGSVRGFALTLGIATVFDVFLSWFFTRPTVSLLSNLKVFNKPWIVGAGSTVEGPAGGDAR